MVIILFLLKNTEDLYLFLKCFVHSSDYQSDFMRGKMEKEILTIDEVAEMFSVSKRTVYTLLKENTLPGVKIGGQWRFLKKDLLQVFLLKNAQKEGDSSNE